MIATHHPGSRAAAASLKGDVWELRKQSYTGLVVDEEGTQYWLNAGKFHREDAPAIICANGKTSWYLNDKLHRDNGPAEEWPADKKGRCQQIWWQHGKKHRIGAPARIFGPNGSFKEWYVDDKAHREDGPACEYGGDGRDIWMLNDVEWPEGPAICARRKAAAELEALKNEITGTGMALQAPIVIRAPLRTTPKPQTFHA